MGQKAQLWWDLPAADGFLLLKEIYRIPDDRYERRTSDELVGMLGVEKDNLNIQVRRLSLGERMKMELIATLLHEPRVVYLDEPTIGLDLTAQRAIRDFILTYREKHRPAMILTSHYMEDIERLCERILIIRDGEIVYDGSLAEVKRAYATHKVHHRASRADVMAGNFDVVGGPRRPRGVRSTRRTGTLRFEVPREEVAPRPRRGSSTGVLRSYDLAIEEMDIGTVIERIFQERGEVPDVNPRLFFQVVSLEARTR